MVSRSFQEDPLCRFIFPDATDRARRAPFFYAFVLRTALLFGEMQVAHDKRGPVAVCCWIHSERLPGFLGYVRAGGARMLWQCGLASGRRVMRIGDFFDARHEHVMSTQPHVFLSFIGVQPESQGQGIGSNLVRAMQARLAGQPEPRPIYLETHSQANAAYYQHLGFDVREELPLFDSEVRHYGMVWKPTGS